MILIKCLGKLRQGNYAIFQIICIELYQTRVRALLAGKEVLLEVEGSDSRISI